MWWHHLVGVLGSTFTIMPNATSASSCCLTSSFQWLGIEAGVWTAIGLVARSILILMGSPVIMGSSWCEQWLNVDAQNLLRNHCFILLLFSSMGSNRRFSGLLGRGCCFGQLHVDSNMVVSSSWYGLWSVLFEGSHLWLSLDVTSLVVTQSDTEAVAPTVGKSGAMILGYFKGFFKNWCLMNSQSTFQFLTYF